jgi:hypothetical protein
VPDGGTLEAGSKQRRRPAKRTLEGCIETLEMSTMNEVGRLAIGLNAPILIVAALRYQHATAERSKEIATYLDEVISAAIPQNRPSASAGIPDGCRMEREQSKRRNTESCPRTGTTRRGGGENRTHVRGFAGPCLNHSATPPCAPNDSRHKTSGQPNGPATERLESAGPVLRTRP